MRRAARVPYRVIRAREKRAEAIAHALLFVMCAVVSVAFAFAGALAMSPAGSF